MREIAHAWPRNGSASQASVLADAVRRYVQRELGLASTPCGRVCVLTHLTYLGVAFNPVSFYYLFDEQDQRVKYVVAEVNNIPWFEQHAYVLCANEHTQPAVQSLSRTNSLVGTRNAPLDDEDCIRPATEHEQHLGSASRNGQNAFSPAEDARWPVDESKPSATVEACGLSAPRWPWLRPSLERTGSTSSLNGSTPSSSCFVLCAAHPKAFHVSPFIGMEGIEYKWLFSQPGTRQMRVFVELLQRRPEPSATTPISHSDSTKFFGASLKLHRVELTALNLFLCLLVYPLVTLQAMLAIHYEAMKLYFRGFPFYPHPREKKTVLSRLIALIAYVAERVVYAFWFFRYLLSRCLLPLRVLVGFRWSARRHQRGLHEPRS